MLPPRFSNYFQQVSETHSYMTRSVTKSALKIVFAKTNRRKKTIKIAGPHIWNELPPHIRQCSSLPSFKRHLKIHLIHTYI